MGQNDCERGEEVETLSCETIVLNEHSYKSSDYPSLSSLRLAEHGKTNLEWAEGRLDLYGLLDFATHTER